MASVKALRILAVEHDRDFAGLLSMLLKKKLEAEVTVAEDCASARNILSSSNFDLITLEYQLPDGDGLQLLEEITSQKDHPPVVMVTVKGDEQTAVNTFRAGAAGYVMKDTRLSIMLPAVIQKALDLKYASESLKVSEVRYRRLFEAAKDGILILDAETGQITDVNPSITNLLGYTSEEVLGKHLWEIGAFKDMKLSKELFSELQSKEYVRYEHLPLETKEGERIDVEFVSNVYPEDHSKVIQCNIRDITVLVEAEADRRRLAAIVDSSEDAIFVKTLDGTIISWNAGAERMYGYTADEIISRNMSVLLPPDRTDEVSTILGGIARGERFDHFETVRVAKDGRLIDTSVTISPVKNTAGNIAGASSVARDITKRKQLEDAVRESEERYHQIFENATEGIFQSALDGTFISINPAFARMHGYDSPEQMKPLKDIAFYFDPLERDEIKRLLAENGSIQEREVRIRRRDGTLIWISLNAHLLKDKDTNSLSVEGTTVDITERKRAERALEESEKKYRVLIDNLSEGIWAIDTEARTTFVNERMAEMLGYSMEEMIGDSLFSFMDECGRADAEEKLERRRQGIVEQHDFEFIRKDGARLNVTMETSPITDESGDFIGALAGIIDITARKRAEEGLQRANTELEIFAHTASHDLRGPLANIEMAIATLLELLAAPQTDKTRTEEIQVAEMLRKSIKRSTNLVEKLLGLAEAGQAPKKVADIDVRRIVERVVEERALDIEEKGIRLEIDPDLGRVAADQTHIYQIFANLISNAIRHNDSQKPVIAVSRLGDDGRGNHRYLVRDNGSGIAADNLDKIFTSFFKGKAGGTGIGLTLVEKIIKVYGGSIRAYNDNGASFEFVLRDFEV